MIGQTNSGIKHKGTPIFQENARAFADPNTRIIINRGGTRSSKTFSIVQLFIMLSYLHENESFLVARYAMPALKATVRKDYREIILRLGLDHEFREFRSNGEERFVNLVTGTEINLTSIDKPQKIFGAKHLYVHLNEADEIKFSDFQQLDFRLKDKGKIFMDFNPRDSLSWIKLELEDKRYFEMRDVYVIKSSYLDNPFLTFGQKKVITYTRENDPNMWAVYGLGEYGDIKNQVFANWEVISDEEYRSAYHDAVFYGQDWGENHPSVLSEIKWHESTLYVDELFHKPFSTEKELIDIYRRKVNKSSMIFADHQFKWFMKLLKLNDFNAQKADKEGGSVKQGIRLMKWYKIKITESSVNTIKDFKNYKYLERDGKITDDVVKFMDDAPDAIRMAVYSMKKYGVLPNGYVGE